MKTRFSIFLFIISSVAFAQVGESDSKLSIKTSLTKDTILIGDRVGLTISILSPGSGTVNFPEFSDSLMKGIEIVKKPTIETRKLPNQMNEQVIKLLITSFDSGTYMLPVFRIPVTDGLKTDTISSNQLMLVVDNLPKDKAVKDIYDIKPPIEEPLTVGEVAPYAFGGLFFVGLIFLLLLFLRRRKQNLPFGFLQKPVDPPHVVALRELEKIKEEKLWLSENHKYYYTRLVDVIRVYIEGRFSVNAMEQTTDEILLGLKHVDFPVDELYHRLQESLTLADLVKFAKYTPYISDNEQNLKFAFEFVEKTKPEVEAKADAVVDDNVTKDEGESKELVIEQENKMLS
jgi:hypothetical protein